MLADTIFGTMETTVFQTNISTAAELSKVSLQLDKLLGKDHWQINLTPPQYLLTIDSTSSIIQVKVEDVLRETGFYVLNLDEYYSIY